MTQYILYVYKVDIINLLEMVFNQRAIFIKKSFFTITI